MNLVTSKYLDPLHKTNNPAMSDSHVQSVVSSQSEDVWRCVLIHKLTEEENGGNHHVYIDLIDQNGARLAANPDLWIRYGWDGMKLDETPPFSPCEKRVGEPVANVEIASLGQVTWVEVVCFGLLSDRVVGLSSAPTGHGSWYVVFQRQAQRTFSTDTESVSVPLDTLRALESSLSSNLAIVQSLLRK